MSDKPRTLALSVGLADALRNQAERAKECTTAAERLAADVEVAYIELEPVLDLLERAGDWLDAEDDIPTVLKGDIDALLREHGRLS